MSKYDGRAGTAEDLLVYYLRTLFQASGLNWDSDNDTEIRELIQAIVSEAKHQIKEGK